MYVEGNTWFENLMGRWCYLSCINSDQYALQIKMLAGSRESAAAGDHSFCPRAHCCKNLCRLDALVYFRRTESARSVVLNVSCTAAGQYAAHKDFHL